ncbi:MAG: hypothetical protein A2Y75_01525 [Candidatus Solincola sediminis]|uniref:Uncharacterized protein n=1 Tax=Candidatus Solincola sediminis TaxID=1797199 RepID=A0A1F2WNI6_9ACTN|nr:MAG: hypothetical protein A2Y75_01525 [Candidatus Solincola sediminis]
MRTKHQCPRCTRAHTAAQWPALEYLSTLELPGDAKDPRPMSQEWRKCVCGNAIQVDLFDPDNELFRITSANARGAA